MKFVFKVCSILGIALGATWAVGYLADFSRGGSWQSDSSVIDLLVCYTEDLQVSDALDEELQAWQHCAEVKRNTCNELIAGKITLREAATRFALAQIAVGEDRQVKWTTYPGDNDQERRSLEVLAWVRSLLAGQPDIADSVQLRLEAEFHALVNRNSNPAAPPRT